MFRHRDAQRGHSRTSSVVSGLADDVDDGGVVEPDEAGDLPDTSTVPDSGDDSGISGLVGADCPLPEACEFSCSDRVNHSS